MSESAKTSKELQAANEEAVDFDVSQFHGLLTHMGEAVAKGNDAEGERGTHTVQFLAAAQAYAETNADIEVTTRVNGFLKSLDAMRSMLAKDSNPLVESGERDDGTTKLTWSGFARNIRSICRGIIQFHGEVDAEGEPLIADVTETDSYSATSTQVKEARALGQSDGDRELALAKVDLRTLASQLIKITVKAGTPSIDRLAVELQDMIDRAVAENAEADAITEEVEAA